MVGPRGVDMVVPLDDGLDFALPIALGFPPSLCVAEGGPLRSDAEDGSLECIALGEFGAVLSSSPPPPSVFATTGGRGAACFS